MCRYGLVSVGPDTSGAAHVAWDHDVGVLEHLLTIHVADEPLAGAEHHGHDVHRHYVDKAPAKAPSGRVWPARIDELELGRRGDDDLATAYRNWLRTA